MQSLLSDGIERNLSAQRMFTEWAQGHTPEYSFAAHLPASFDDWKAEAWPKVKATLGDWPDRAEPAAQMTAEWFHDGLTKQRWIMNVGLNASVIFQINYPEGFDPQSGEKLPSILCWHGHGKYGKEPVMGNDSTPELAEDIARLNYNYGHVMAKNGFITFAIDWMNGGDRQEAVAPNWNHQNGRRDWCNIFYLHATMFGMTPLSINLSHGMAATDFACTLPGVDSERLGVMGLSGGGTMTAWTALCDERFRAAEIICYSNLWQHFGIRDSNYCGMQVAPGLYKLVDVPDLQGLIAPRPLLVDIGAYDYGFHVESAMASFHQVEAIYEAAGKRENLELDLFPGAHAWGGNKSVEFFKKNLRGI